MFDTNIHFSSTLLNEYFLAILQYFLEHWLLALLLAFRTTYLKYNKNGKSITSAEGVYIPICNDNYKLMQFIFIPFSRNLLITFRL